MSSEYNAAAIEVLTGLDPVRKRPACTRIQHAESLNTRSG